MTKWHVEFVQNNRKRRARFYKDDRRIKCYDFKTYEFREDSCIVKVQRDEASMRFTKKHVNSLKMGYMFPGNQMRQIKVVSYMF